MDAVSENAFSVSNGKDPLFLHFRVKSKKTNIFRIMKTALESSFGANRIYKPAENVDIGTVPLSELLGKVICILDLNYTPDCTSTDCQDLMKVIAVSSNSTKLKTNTESETMAQPKINISQLSPSDSRTNISTWKMVTPDLGALYTSANYSIWFDLIKYHGVQIIPYQYYIDDESLSQYDKFFEKQKIAMVTLATTLTFIKSIG